MSKGLNKELFTEAKKYIPGGVNSPVRAFKAVGGTPLFIKKAKGAKIFDIEGKRYIDYCMSWGALILGHAYPDVIKQVKSVVENGTSFGAPTQQETEFAREICNAFPSIEMVRLVNSGTEACMSAIRLARAYTKKAKIIKFAGCYHGHADCLLAKSGSGIMTFSIPETSGVPKNSTKDTFVLLYNNLDIVEKVVKKHHEDIACIIVEPIAANMGVVLPENRFLSGLREISDYYKIILIFDEIITGFRVAYGGAQELFKIKPDLTCLGKILGGGFPIGAFGGKKEIMKNLSPAGEVYQAGTLSGNPVCVSAGLMTLKILKTVNYTELEEKTKYLCEMIKNNARKFHVNITINQIGSMFTIFFTDKEVYNYETAKSSNTKLYSMFFREMLKQEIYFPPAQFESCFISTAHTEKDIEKTISVSEKVLKVLKR